MKIDLSSSLVCAVLGVIAYASTGNGATVQLSPQTLNIYVGGTSGFGFSFTNDASGWAAVTQSFLSQLFVGYGTYTDLIGLQNIVIAPGATFSQFYDAGSGTGAGSYTLRAAATAGTKVPASLNLDYDVFSVDPNSAAFNGFTDYLSSQQISTAVTLVAVPTPEPAGWTLGACGLLVLLTAGWLMAPVGNHDVAAGTIGLRVKESPAVVGKG